MSHTDGPPDVEVTRIMALSPAAIWSAWTDPAAIARWWGPAGFTSMVHELEVGHGGRFEVVMRGPDGVAYANVYLFEDVQPERQVTFVHQGSEEWGLPRPARSC